MEIIILGLVLLIVGVGATIVYDRYKDRLTVALREKRAALKATRPAVNPKTIPNKVLKANDPVPTLDNMLKELSKKFHQSAQGKPKVSQKKKIYKPIRAGFVKPGDQPTEAIHEEITVEDLVKKIEQIKKRPGPRK